MSPRCIRALEMEEIYSHFCQPVPYFKCIEVEREFKLDDHTYSCKFEISLKLWRDDEGYPSVDCVSDCEAYDQGGHCITDKGIRAKLNAMSEAWAKENVDELAEEVRNK